MEQMRQYLERVAELAEWVQPIFENALDDPASCDAWRDQIQDTMNAWMDDVMATMALGAEVRSAQLGAEPDRKVRFTLHVHVWMELARMRWLLSHVALSKERATVARLRKDELSDARYYDTRWSLSVASHSMWPSLRDTYEGAAAIRADKDDELETDDSAREVLKRLRDMWEKPILLYSQSEVRTLLMFMSEQQGALPTVDRTAMSEFRRAMRLMWVRTAELSALSGDDNSHDEPDLSVACSGGVRAASRHWLVMCSTYMIQLERRLFLDTLLRSHLLRDLPSEQDIRPMRDAVRAWCEHLMTLMPEDAISSSLENSTREGFAFGGDDTWFSYQWPTRMNTRGAVVTALRPHLYRRFYSEESLPTSALLRANTPTTRNFMLRLIDEQLRSLVPGSRWYDGCVIDADLFESNKKKLLASMGPTLVQATSSYWVCDDGRVHCTDDLYASVALWMWILRTRYNGRLCGVDFNAALDAVLPSASVGARTGVDRGEGFAF